MNLTDPVADFLTRIRNSIRARHQKLDVPASKLKSEIARILKEEGYIANYKPAEENGMKVLRVETLDGVKFFLENATCAGKKNAAETWLLLRASGTKPLLRVYCESCSVESVDAVLNVAREFVLKG